MALADAPPRSAPHTHPSPLPHPRSPDEDAAHVLGPMCGAAGSDETVFIISVTVGTGLYRVRMTFPSTTPLDDPADPGGGQADVAVDPLPLPALGCDTDDGAHAGPYDGRPAGAHGGLLAVLQAAQAALQVRYEQERTVARHPGWVRLWHDAATRLACYQQDYLALARAADATA